MVGEAIAGLGAFNSMLSILNTLKSVNDTVQRNAVAVELGEQIIAAQARYTTAIQRIDQLEKEVASFEKWDAQEKRYQLKDFGGGTFAYELKAEEAGSEPAHRICPGCYEKRHRSILQFRHKNSYSQDHYQCNECKAEFDFGHRHNPPPRQPRVISRGIRGY